MANFTSSPDLLLRQWGGGAVVLCRPTTIHLEPSVAAEDFINVILCSGQWTMQQTVALSNFGMVSDVRYERVPCWENLDAKKENSFFSV